MLVKDLIKELEKLPSNATIGVVYIDDMSIEDSIQIIAGKYKEYEVCNLFGYSATIEEIESARNSNKSRVCDYYIV